MALVPSRRVPSSGSAAADVAEIRAAVDRLGRNTNIVVMPVPGADDIDEGITISPPTVVLPCPSSNCCLTAVALPSQADDKKPEENLMNDNAIQQRRANNALPFFVEYMNAFTRSTYVSFNPQPDKLNLTLGTDYTFNEENAKKGENCADIPFVILNKDGAGVKANIGQALTDALILYNNDEDRAKAVAQIMYDNALWSEFEANTPAGENLRNFARPYFDKSTMQCAYNELQRRLCIPDAILAPYFSTSSKIYTKIMTYMRPYRAAVNMISQLYHVSPVQHINQAIAERVASAPLQLTKRFTALPAIFVEIVARAAKDWDGPARWRKFAPAEFTEALGPTLVHSAKSVSALLNMNRSKPLTKDQVVDYIQVMWTDDSVNVDALYNDAVRIFNDHVPKDSFVQQKQVTAGDSCPPVPAMCGPSDSCPTILSPKPIAVAKLYPSGKCPPPSASADTNAPRVPVPAICPGPAAAGKGAAGPRRNDYLGIF